MFGKGSVERALIFEPACHGNLTDAITGIYQQILRHTDSVGVNERAEVAMKGFCYDMGNIVLAVI